MLSRDEWDEINRLAPAWKLVDKAARGYFLEVYRPYTWIGANRLWRMACRQWDLLHALIYQRKNPVPDPPLSASAATIESRAERQKEQRILIRKLTEALRAQKTIRGGSVTVAVLEQKLERLSRRVAFLVRCIDLHRFRGPYSVTCRGELLAGGEAEQWERLGER
jgi:hypothetical protein